MTTPVPPGDQPTYVDPVTGQPLYIDPTTGQLAYTDPTAGAVRSPYPEYPGYAPATAQSPYLPPAGGAVPSTGFTAPAYPPPAQYGYAPYPGYAGYPMVATQRNNPMAITSMILSIVGVVTFWCYGVGGLLGLAGAILGHIARKQVTVRGEAGGGMALAGIICGWIALALGIGAIAFFVYVFTHLNSFTDSPSDFPS